MEEHFKTDAGLRLCGVFMPTYTSLFPNFEKKISPENFLEMETKELPNCRHCQIILEKYKMFKEQGEGSALYIISGKNRS